MTETLKEALSVKGLPLVGNMFSMFKGAEGCLYDAYRQLAQKHGDWVRFQIPGYRFFMTSDPDAMKEVLATRMNDFPKGSTLDEARALGLGAKGLTEVEGEEWSQQRRMMMGFYQPKRVNEFFPAINATGDKVTKVLSAQQEMKSVNFFNRTVLYMAYHSLFGMESNLLDDLEYEDPVQYRQNWVVNQMMTRAAIGPWYKKLPIPVNYKLTRLVNEQKAMFDRALTMHLENPGKFNTLLANYIGALDDKGKKLSRDDLHDQIQTFLGGGLESVGSVLTWLFAFLTKHPEWQEKIYEEIMATVPEGPIEPSHLKSMETLQNCIAESLRLRPAFPILIREAAADDQLGGYRIRKGEVIVIPIQWMMTRPDIWGPTAEEYDPTRFKAGNPPEEAKEHYFPFGYGPRICIGRRLAEAQSSIIASHLIRAFRFRQKAGQSLAPMLRFSWYPKDEVTLELEKRIPIAKEVPIGA